ncbi:unnamed protein product [Musa acuminata subsp. malaccensis]|uniref:(wild Malaysian banana) hypothetical protein n=1 Tax=Musa acuminata subsp. malaccensis TaxID=214687 RepID=A0A8D7B1A3_MUSAM|nr:PREDICTED: uncharacterized protein LOC103979772 [Musa acuminata subsp. malaccensis]CAG1858336.1 unnamed protein product [Musa acuminata subsp. malaccensis]
MDASFIPQSSHGTMDEDDGESFSSVPGSSTSSSSDDMDDTASSASPTTEEEQHGDGPLYEMASLVAQLPFKRGLSKYYQGKSKTFTSLSSVRCLEDLAKPERPQRKKMKPCKSYGWGLDSQRSLSPKESSRTITKKASRGPLSSLGGRKHSFVSGGRPPVAPQRSNNFSSQTLLFA